MVTKYERGRAVEYRIQRELEAVGYTTARAAGSKGKFDVLAWDRNHYRIIQAKSFVTRAGSFADDVGQIRAILCPPNTRRELWVWKKREGWQCKLIIGDREEEDRLLPIAEADDAGPGRYYPTVIGPDGRQRTFHQSLPLPVEYPAPPPGYSVPDSRRAYGAPITITCVGTQELRDVLRGVRSAVEEAGLKPLLQREVPARRPRKARTRRNQPKA